MIRLDDDLPRERIRVFLLVDQAMLRGAIKRLLARDLRYEVVGDTDEPRAALAAARELRPDVILCDVPKGGPPGIDAITSLRQELPRSRILALTHLDSESIDQQVMRSGADACLSKDFDPEQLATVLRAGGWPADRRFPAPCRVDPHV